MLALATMAALVMFSMLELALAFHLKLIKGAATAFGSVEPTPLGGLVKGQVTAAHTALHKSTTRTHKPQMWVEVRRVHNN